MKVVVIGATGTIGKAVVNQLNPRHEIIQAGYTNGDINVDITCLESIKAMYEKIKAIDAIVMTTGKVAFKALMDFDEEAYRLGLDNKLLGQINVVQLGLSYLNDQGSFTLTSGILNYDPIRTGASAAMVNAALDGFVKASAIEMPRGLRINAVSPTVITEAMVSYESYFRGYQPVSAAVAALAYSKSVEGLQTGQVYKVGYS